MKNLKKNADSVKAQGSITHRGMVASKNKESQHLIANSYSSGDINKLLRSIADGSMYVSVIDEHNIHFNSG